MTHAEEALAFVLLHVKSKRNDPIRTHQTCNYFLGILRRGTRKWSIRHRGLRRQIRDIRAEAARRIRNA